MQGRALLTQEVEKVRNMERVKPKSCTSCLVTCNPSDTPYCITNALISAVKGDYENGLFFCSESAGKVNKMKSVHELMGELMSVWRSK